MRGRHRTRQRRDRVRKAAMPLAPSPVACGADLLDVRNLIGRGGRKGWPPLPAVSGRIVTSLAFWAVGSRIAGGFVIGPDGCWNNLVRIQDGDDSDEHS
jgi:hypothetical protein